jgi:hypothetical protein
MLFDTSSHLVAASGAIAVSVVRVMPARNTANRMVVRFTASFQLDGLTRQPSTVIAKMISAQG